MRTIAATLLLLAAWPAAADVVLLNNGDRITGKAQRLENGKLFFQSSHSDTPLQIDWKLVENLTTESEVAVTLDDGTGKIGLLATSPALRTSAIVSFKPKAIEESPESVGWLGRTRENVSLSLDFGQSYSGLARYNQFSLNSEADYRGDRWDGSMVTHFDFYEGTDSSRSTYQGYSRIVAQRYIRGDHFFLFPYGFLGRQTTEETKGQLRQFGGGAGWTFRRHESDQISIYAGLVRSAGTGFAEGTGGERVDSRITDTLFVSAVSWEKTLRNKVEMSMRLFYFKPVNQSGFHAMATDASAKIPLFGPAYLSVRAYDTPELRQRQLFSTRNLQLSSGIGIEF